MCISFVCRFIRLNLVLLRSYMPVICSHAFCLSHTRLLNQSTRQCTHIHPFYVLYVNFILTHVKVYTITVNMNNLTSSYTLEDYFDREYVTHYQFEKFCASSDVKYRCIENKRFYSLFLVLKPTYVNFMVSNISHHIIKNL